MIATRWIPPWIRRRSGVIDVGAPMASGNRVSVPLPGGDLWFECDDARLEPSLEAFIGLLVLPAMQRRATIASGEPIDSMWLAGARRNVARFSSWWDYDHDPLARLDGVPRVETADAVERRPGRRAGLCFTGGIDSFHELLREPDRFSHLVFLLGPDIALDDRQRAESVRSMLHDVASKTGTQALWLRTNLQEHPLTRRVEWERLHGAGLAAAGHLLCGVIDSLTIAASFDYRRIQPWGSHPETDPDWSSSRFRVLHGDFSRRRAQRLGAVAAHPLVRRYLRVCTKKRTPTGNCSTCRKCVLTMTHLAALGQLEQSRAFDLSIPLAARLDAMSDGGYYRRKQWREIFTDGDLPPDVASAVRRLIERSNW